MNFNEETVDTENSRGLCHKHFHTCNLYHFHNKLGRLLQYLCVRLGASHFQGSTLANSKTLLKLYCIMSVKHASLLLRGVNYSSKSFIVDALGVLENNETLL